MRIHCIGIGGIGVSALAQYYLTQGYQVSGSDLEQSEITDFLKKKGVKIMIGNKAEHIQKDVDLVVYSPAVRQDNSELQQAKKYNLKIITYPQALGELTRSYYTIAISGSHGKSTTTAMIALILLKAGIDPTVIVGTKLKEFGNSNFRAGKSKYLVIEACEYDGSFLEYSPKIAVITNVDKEHLDYFKTFANVKKAFQDFAKKVPPDGFLVTQKNLAVKDAKKLKLQVPGKHNVSNALAALAVARILGIKDSVSFKALGEFTGTWRRFEIKPSTISQKLITIVSDYGHHPNEVKATLQAAREKWPSNPSTGLRARKIWLIYQPHQYQRTHYLFKDFVILFKKAPVDHIFITDIYDVAGREVGNITKGVSSKMLVEKVNKKHVLYYANPNQAAGVVKKSIQNSDVLIIMGAGDIYKLVDTF